MGMKRLLAVLAAAVLLAAAGAGTTQVNAASRPTFKLPANAKPLPDGSYSLGVKTDPTTGKHVEGIAFVDYNKQNIKAAARTPGGKTSCYAFLSRGMKWKTAEPWLLDQTNTGSMDSNYLLTHTTANIAKWETAASANFFGDGTLSSGLSADEATPDGQNEVMFGAIADPSVIAVTIVWGYYSGPAQFKEILEWDQIYNDQDYAWSTSGEANKMDFDNISTHEIGHAAGLGHPGNSCTAETMYAYADYGETKKRDLNAGDIAGINALY